MEVKPLLTFLWCEEVLGAVLLQGARCRRLWGWLALHSFQLWVLTCPIGSLYLLVHFLEAFHAADAGADCHHERLGGLLFMGFGDVHGLTGGPTVGWDIIRCRSIKIYPIVAMAVRDVLDWCLPSWIASMLIPQLLFHLYWCWSESRSLNHLNLHRLSLDHALVGPWPVARTCALNQL